MPYCDETFDKLFSVSVIEHIPEKGDIEAIKEFSRVIKKGGQIILTVPYDKKGFTEYTKTSAYWIPESNKPSFYQRRYSHQDLTELVIESVDLKIKKLFLIAEKPIKPAYLRPDGTLIHNHFFIDQMATVRFLKKTHIPYLRYLFYSKYTDKLQYLAADPNDPNIRNAVLYLVKE